MRGLVYKSVLLLLTITLLLMPLVAQKTGKSMRIQGKFDVKMTPLELAQAEPDTQRARFKLEKQYYGELVAHATGEMLSGGDPKSGSAGYVAIERVTGTLNGRKGSFLLQHSATMHQGSMELSVKVIPGTGTEELSGLSGSMEIQIGPKGEHSYVFQYEIPEAK